MEPSLNVCDKGNEMQASRNPFWGGDTWDSSVGSKGSGQGITVSPNAHSLFSPRMFWSELPLCQEGLTRAQSHVPADQLWEGRGVAYAGTVRYSVPEKVAPTLTTEEAVIFLCLTHASFSMNFPVSILRTPPYAPSCIAVACWDRALGRWPLAPHSMWE